MKPRTKLKPLFTTDPERGKHSMSALKKLIERSVQPLEVKVEEEPLAQYNLVETVGRPLIFYFR